jgi:hypothetical protein
MADLHQTVSALLEQAANGPVPDPPVDEVVGRSRRRLRARRITQVLGTVAAVTAIVASIALAVPTRSGKTPPPPAATQRPQPAPSSLLGAASAAQIAHGHWQNIAPPPVRMCGSTAAIWTGTEVVVVVAQDSLVCGNAAAGYDPQTDRWRRFTPPPRIIDGYLSTAWTGEKVVVVSGDTRAVAELDIQTGNWSNLPQLPAQAKEAVVAWDGRQVLVIGAGPDRDEVFASNGGSWRSLARLPHATGESVVNIATFVLGSSVWAVDAVEHHSVDSGGTVVSVGVDSHLLRLVDGAWREMAKPADMPLIVTSVQQLDSGQLIVGTNCPPRAPCPMAPAMLETVHLGQPQGHLLSRSPLDMVLADGYSTGHAVLVYNAYAVESGPHRNVRRGDTAVFDLLTGRWLQGPRSVLVDDVIAEVWTPHGFVVLGEPVEKCVCRLGGVMLRPAKR